MVCYCVVGIFKGRNEGRVFFYKIRRCESEGDERMGLGKHDCERCEGRLWVTPEAGKSQVAALRGLQLQQRGRAMSNLVGGTTKNERPKARPRMWKSEDIKA